MKTRLLCFVLIFFAAIPSVFATTTVSGKIQNLGTGNVTSNAFVRFWLRGCGGNQPRVNGTAIIGPSQGGVFFFDIAADGTGTVSGTIYSTRDATGLLAGDIECGGSKTAVWYGMQVFVGGKGGPEVPVHALNTGTLDITQVTPITTNPVVTAPTGDSTYARLDGGNQPFTGNVQAPNVTVTSAVSGATVTASGQVQGATLKVGGDAVLSSSPRPLWNTFFPGPLTSQWTGSSTLIDKAVTITHVTGTLKTSAVTCSPNAVLRITDGVTPLNFTVALGGFDSGVISQNYAASSTLTVSISTAAAGCGTSPADLNVVVEYRMQ